MGIKDDYHQAVALAKQGKFEQARSLLIAHDHPKTNALLDKVNAAIASSGEAAPHAKQVNPILRAIAAIVVFSISTGITVTLAAWLASYPYGFTNEAVMWSVFIGIWVLLMFIGFRVSQSILQRP